MNDATCPTFHDTSLPVLSVPRNGTLRLRNLPDGLGVAMPPAFAAVIIHNLSYGVLVHPDGTPELVRDVKQNRAPQHQRIEPSYIILANHGQKLSVAGGYWIVNAPSACVAPTLAFC
jgi:hypothetical protein